MHDAQKSQDFERGHAHQESAGDRLRSIEPIAPDEARVPPLKSSGAQVSSLPQSGRRHQLRGERAGLVRTTFTPLACTIGCAYWISG